MEAIPDAPWIGEHPYDYEEGLVHPERDYDLEHKSDKELEQLNEIIISHAQPKQLRKQIT